MIYVSYPYVCMLCVCERERAHVRTLLLFDSVSVYMSLPMTQKQYKPNKEKRYSYRPGWL